MSFVEACDVHMSYAGPAGEVHALAGINLGIDDGAFLGIMGASGSGKSTLLSILGGLCGPTKGSVRVDGIDLYALSSERLADFRREYLGFVFQSYNLIPYLTAIENVLVPLAVKPMLRSNKIELARRALDRVGLGGRLGHLPSQLSGGEQERVAIGRAIVNSPPLLLADEPTGSVDSRTSDTIMTLLSELNSEGQTIVMVTHDADNRAYFSDTVTLSDGRTAEGAVPAGRVLDRSRSA